MILMQRSSSLHAQFFMHQYKYICISATFSMYIIQLTFIRKVWEPDNIPISNGTTIKLPYLFENMFFKSTCIATSHSM